MTTLPRLSPVYPTGLPCVQRQASRPCCPGPKRGHSGHVDKRVRGIVPATEGSLGLFEREGFNVRTVTSDTLHGCTVQILAKTST